MMRLLEHLERSPMLSSLVGSALLVIVVLIGRSLSLRWLRGQRMPSDGMLRWRAQVRNATVLVLLLGLTILWAEQLRAVAISVVAIAAALVIGMKELLMCLTGSLLRASGSQFKIGDRIEIAGYRGDVIDIGPLTTSMLEVGPTPALHQRTGRVVVLPNSIFLGGAVINETLNHHFVIHTLRVPMARTADWTTARDRLIELAGRSTAEYIGAADHSMTRLAIDRGLEAPNVRPNVAVELTKPDELDLLLRFPVPVNERGRLAQQILERFLELEQADRASD